MKVAVTGPAGQLGSELVRQGYIPLKGRFFSPDMIEEIEQIAPDVIINCAAKTNVDSCEAELAAAIDVNTRAVRFLQSCFDGYLVQISTDYIFDGMAGPYTPTDPPNPLSIYGWSKLGGELITRQHKGLWLIIRTTVLFSEAENNFVAKMVRQLAQGKPVTLYQSGLRGTPTYVPKLAAEIIRMVNKQYTGVAHVAGSYQVDRAEFADAIVAAFGLDPSLIIPTDNKSLTSAPRPPIAGLISDHRQGKISYPVNSHNPLYGLRELAERYKTGEIWK
jgi:dTDP-4-dehydrorhamnose reductase